MKEGTDITLTEKKNDNIHFNTKSDIQDKMNIMIRNMTNGEDSLKKVSEIYHMNRLSRKSNTNK